MTLPSLARVLMALSCLALATAAARAQSIPGAVLARDEPHHHLAYEDSTIRVLRVRVAPHDSTLLHEHTVDYFWVALGNSAFVNAPLGKSEALVKAADLSVHYTPGKFAHVARNPGTSNFDNITIELLGTQTNPHNLCEPAVAGLPVDCPFLTPSSGVDERPAFATDQLRVSLVTIAPGGALRSGGVAPYVLVVALDTTDVGTALALASDGGWRGGVYRPSGRAWAVQNRSGVLRRVVLITSPAGAR